MYDNIHSRTQQNINKLQTPFNQEVASLYRPPQPSTDLNNAAEKSTSSADAQYVGIPRTKRIWNPQVEYDFKSVHTSGICLLSRSLRLCPSSAAGQDEPNST